MKSITRRDFLKYSGTGLAGLAVAMHFPLLTPRRALASSGAWTFGVMSDTQWKQDYPNNGENPNSCAVSIINALNQQFIHHDCKFVIQVGDLCDKESVNGVRSMPTRADAAAALYKAAIGFFPVRGNHEASAIAASELPVLFPQTLGNGPNVYGATNFESPFDSLRGLSYSFDFENVRCVLIDQFVRPDGSNYDGTSSYNNNAVDQIAWVDSMLSSKSSDSHAFVFSHKNLIGQNHKDNLFGSGLTSNPGPRDEFLSSLCGNGVRYQLGGHDHMHHRSIVKTADGQSSVGQIICSSNSYKFYIPRSGDDGREMPLQQELFTVGYYIFTVDGPRVYVDYYSSSHGADYGDSDLLASPPMTASTFFLRETFGYSLNGKQFQLARGESYTSVEDSYKGTTARILSGTNGNTETDYLNRNLAKTVNTGW
ncbi:MAG TPA: metallophosphoesterase, partial [Geobacteraceae bacterium]|nr:metallophosphoesterase [Geobacteraceae bacterium]